MCSTGPLPVLPSLFFLAKSDKTSEGGPGAHSTGTRWNETDWNTLLKGLVGSILWPDDTVKQCILEPRHETQNTHTLTRIV